MIIYLTVRTLSLLLLSPSYGMSLTLLALLLAWRLLVLKLIQVSSHTLLVLLILEFFILFFLLLLLNLHHSLFSSSSFVLRFFTLAVCEASLGLGLLIAVSRKFGSQLLTALLAFKLNKLPVFKAGNILDRAVFSILITLNFQLINL